MTNREHWEELFANWSKGPQKTETDRIENTKRVISEAIKNDENLNSRNIKIFVQGSYKNSVNVRKDSDIDIGVLCSDTFYYVFNDEDIKEYQKEFISPATYSYYQFKNDVETALVKRFGRENVKRGKKAFNIKSSSTRVDADVSAFFEHRRYYAKDKYHQEVEMISDDNQEIVNWPEQHYENGVAKNDETLRRYKRTVRIFKKLNNVMEENKIISENIISSFFIECLIWNVPNKYFNYDNHYDRVKEVIRYLYHQTKNDNNLNEWGEVSELKYVFRGVNRSVTDANDFVLKAWNYVGFSDD